MKIPISTKPFLSFFICLATFIAHSSPSLSTSHNLHKRMEGLFVKSASLANRLEEARVGESARGGYVEATENLEKVEGPGFTSRPVMEELHHTNQAPVKPIGEVTARGFVNQALKRFKDTILKFAQKIRKFFFQSNAEIFDGIGIFKKYPELLPLVRESESLDEGIEKFMTKVLNHPRTRIINLPLFEKEKAKLKQSFRNLHDVLKKSQEAANINFAPYEEISKELGRIPLPKYEKLSPTQALGRMMATYQSKALAEDQEILRKSLPKHQKYLSRVFGFVGPENVLEPWLQAALEEKIQSGEFQFFGNPAGFLSELKLIQTDLADLARFHRNSPIVPIKPHPEPSGLDQKAISKIVKHEYQLINLFGGRDKLKRALDNLEDMNFHKIFMQELKRPTSLTGLQLQFLEPWGHLRNGIEDKELIHSALGIEIMETSLQYKIEDEMETSLQHTIEHQADNALKYVENILKNALETKKEMKNILEILQPKGLETLVKELKENAKVKKNDDNLLTDSKSK